MTSGTIFTANGRRSGKTSNPGSGTDGRLAGQTLGERVSDNVAWSGLFRVGRLGNWLGAGGWGRNGEACGQV